MVPSSKDSPTTDRHYNSPELSRSMSAPPLSSWEGASVHPDHEVELQDHELRVRGMEAVQYECLLKTNICWTRAPETVSGCQSHTASKGQSKRLDAIFLSVNSNINGMQHFQGKVPDTYYAECVWGTSKRWLYPVSKCDGGRVQLCLLCPVHLRWASSPGPHQGPWDISNHDQIETWGRSCMRTCSPAPGTLGLERGQGSLLDEETPCGEQAGADQPGPNAGKCSQTAGYWPQTTHELRQDQGKLPPPA